MGLGTREHVKYLRFKSIEKKDSNGNTVYDNNGNPVLLQGIAYDDNGTEAIADDITGVVTGVRFKDTRFTHDGKNVEFRSINVDIVDGGDKYVIDEKSGGSVGRQLQLKLLNTQVGDTVTIAPGFKDKTGKRNKYATGVFVNIGRTSVPQKYTSTNPGDCPPWEKIMVKGKEQWDNTKELQFLEAEIVKHFASADAVEHASQQGEFHESEIPQWDDSPSDEVPF